MNIVFEKASNVKKIFESTTDLVTDVTLRISDEGLYSQTMDMTRVCICEIKMAPEDFKEFSCSEEMIISFNVPTFIKFLKCFEEKKPITLSCDDGDQLLLQGESGAYQMPLMELEDDLMDLSSVTYSNTVTIPSQRWCDILEKHEFIGDECELSFIEKAIQFKFQGDAGKAIFKEKMPGSEDNDESVDEMASMMESMDMENKPVGLFGIRYLLAVTKINKLAKMIDISYCEDLPLCLTTRLSPESYMRCYIAPRIE